MADQLSIDCVTDEAGNRPAFLFHLGDVVYNFGESRYYYDQFYEPYRAYPAPVFAVAGNHDSFVIPGNAAWRGAACHLCTEFLLAAAGHRTGGRVAASHRHDAARRLFRVGRPVRPDHRAVQQCA